MASIIDNRNKTMLDSLKNSLKQAESVDILTAFFYFSGFNALAEDLKDKKIRILVAMFIKRLLVMRFESSKSAFKSTLESILYSYENIIKWWEKGFVPIMTRGYLPNPDDEEIQETLDEINRISEDGIDIEKLKKKAIPFERKYFKNDFIIAVESDIELLRTIYKEWFEGNEVGEDPKYNEISRKIKTLLKEYPSRKLVVFSTYADTAEYVHERLINDGFKALLYTGGSTKIDRTVVKRNFDASCKHSDQLNDYDIIIATDALSEGFNLNRAGVIINYDIPYNPNIPRYILIFQVLKGTPTDLLLALILFSIPDNITQLS